MRVTYSKAQLKFLRKGYSLMKVQALTQAFNAKFATAKTEVAISSALKNHGIKCGRKPCARLMPLRVYNLEHLQFLRNKYRKLSLPELVDAFNKHFGLGMSFSQISSCLKTHNITSGRNGRFEKGHQVWNAGTKGLTGANSTSFRKGNMPANRKTLGAERITKDGNIEIKIAERNPYTGFPTRYKLKHLHIWEKANGHLPPGTALLFKNGNKLACDLGNLMLVSRAELLRLNQRGYAQHSDALKPTVLAIAKLEVKTFTISKKKK